MPRLLKIIIIALLFTAIPSFNAEAKNDDDKMFTVIIDAGHGGKDIGATDNGVMEKNINLKVARQLESLIKKKLKDTKVILTRDDDSYLTLQQRADIANKAQGDLFISIHVNSVSKKNKNRKNISGSSVYTLGLHKDEDNLQVAMRENSVIEYEKDFEQKYSGFDPQRDESYIIFEMAQKKNLSQSIKFAETVEKELVASGRQDRGVHQAGFWVLWATSMPSVLVELDFICNPQSAKYMSSEKGEKELATAIFNAVEKYKASSWKRISNNKPDSDHVYYQGKENEDDRLTDSFTEVNPIPEQVAVVSGRKKKTNNNSENVSLRNPALTNSSSSRRRRRSASSKMLSNNVSYELESLELQKKKTTNVLVASDVDVLAQEVSPLASNDSKKSSKKKKEKVKKEKTKKESKKTVGKNREDSHNAKVNKLVTVYKIQLLASSDLLNQNNSRFCGLSPISTYKENDLYKYYYGESTDKAELEALLTDVKKKIPDAFIVTSTKSITTSKKY